MFTVRYLTEYSQRMPSSCFTCLHIVHVYINMEYLTHDPDLYFAGSEQVDGFVELKLSLKYQSN